MRITKYGEELRRSPGEAEALRRATEGLSGASAHAAACGADAGLELLLTGVDYKGRRFRREARSVAGALATMAACRGLNSAWHLLDGKRRLVLAR